MGDYNYDWTVGCVDIVRARTKQIRRKGYTFEHDAGHRKGELINAAIVYAMSAGGATEMEQAAAIWWPFPEPFKPSKDKTEDLADAGALLAAEIDRLVSEGHPYERDWGDVLAEVNDVADDAATVRRLLAVLQNVNHYFKDDSKTNDDATRVWEEVRDALDQFKDDICRKIVRCSLSFAHQPHDNCDGNPLAGAFGKTLKRRRFQCERCGGTGHEMWTDDPATHHVGPCRDCGGEGFLGEMPEASK